MKLIIAFKYKNSSGFTIFEMIVVMVLVSLISMLLIQGLSFVMNLRVNILEQVKKHTEITLQSHWFREVTMSMFPGCTDENNVFSGDNKHFRGLSLAPLAGSKGIPTIIDFELLDDKNDKNEIILQYREADKKDWNISKWHAQSASFFYLDESGGQHPKWPPGDMKKWPQLPCVILFEVKDVSGNVLWFVNISGRHLERIRPEDILHGL